MLDLGPILEEVSREEGIFDNITEAVSKDGKVCAMPCEVRIPVMMADKKYIAEVQDIEDVADMTEALRTENPGRICSVFVRPEALCGYTPCLVCLPG